MNKILLSITTLTLSAFLVTNTCAADDHTSGDKGADVLATVAPKSKKMSQGDVKTKKANKVAGSTEGLKGGDKGADVVAGNSHQDGDKGADVVAGNSHQDGDKGADVVAGNSHQDGDKGSDVVAWYHQDGDKGSDVLATVAPKSKKINNSKSKPKNQSSK